VTVHLLDVNLLIALAWPTHVHHEPAHRWYRKRAAGGWATCPLTQLGFVRLSSNPAIIPGAVSVPAALEVLRDFTRAPHHVFWPDDVSLSDRRFPPGLLLGHRQVTDAYLLALAVRRGGRLATLDRGLSALLPSGHGPAQVLEIVPVA
jgi:toxin-antitoxin system PIN domain toxin